MKIEKTYRLTPDLRLLPSFHAGDPSWTPPVPKHLRLWVVNHNVGAVLGYEGWDHFRKMHRQTYMNPKKHAIAGKDLVQQSRHDVLEYASLYPSAPFAGVIDSVKLPMKGGS